MRPAPACYLIDGRFCPLSDKRVLVFKGAQSRRSTAVGPCISPRAKAASTLMEGSLSFRSDMRSPTSSATAATDCAVKINRTKVCLDIVFITLQNEAKLRQ